MDPRLDATAYLAPRLEHLLRHLADGEDHGAQDAGRVGEERRVRLRGAEPGLTSFSPLIVSSEVGASPENRFEMLTPSSTSRPRPLPTRASMTAASSGRLATTSRPSSRSNQRNAGMPSLLPCSSSAWLTGVVEGTRAVHSVQVWLPDRTQRLMVGMLPARISFSSRGAGTPSSLHEDHAGDVRVLRAVTPLGHPHGVDGEVVAAVDAECPGDERQRPGVGPRRDHGAEDAGDRDPWREAAQPGADDRAVGEQRERHRAEPPEEQRDPEKTGRSSHPATAIMTTATTSEAEESTSMPGVRAMVPASTARRSTKPTPACRTAREVDGGFAEGLGQALPLPVVKRTGMPGFHSSTSTTTAAARPAKPRRVAHRSLSDGEEPGCRLAGREEHRLDELAALAPRASLDREHGLEHAEQDEGEPDEPGGHDRLVGREPRDRTDLVRPEEHDHAGAGVEHGKESGRPRRRR